MDDYAQCRQLTAARGRLLLMLAALDLTTLTVTLTLVTLSMTLLLALAAWHAGTEQGLRHWALGNCALMLGLLLNVNQQHLHHSLSVVLANGLMTLGLGVVWLGVRAFKGRSQPQWGPICAAAVVMLLLWFFRFQVDHLDIRYAISSVTLGGLCLMCARELLIRAAQPLRTAYWFSGSIALLYGFCLVARPLAALFGWQSDLPLLDSPLQNLTLLGAMLAQIGMASGFILMTHYRTAEALHRLSERDALTDTLNRRSLQEQAHVLLGAMEQRSQPVTLIMVDADHFKRINDEYGHQTGDAVLCHLVARIGQHLRSDDLLGRFGGEEFTLILPGLDTERAAQVAERIRQGLCSNPWESESKPVWLSVSLGVACSEHHGYDFNTLLGAADAALYRAKALGRNRVELAPAPGADLKDQMALRLLSQFRHNLDV
jgi:diguanylate cyclase (GGDEF)-like protein